MDQYPDENEEFELQYQDELELMNEFPPEEQNGNACELLCLSSTQVIFIIGGYIFRCSTSYYENAHSGKSDYFEFSSIASHKF